ncbi:glycosyltransferase family 4 protein [Arvimicrobium flavum]|uniref:glycosyltransferase family 4 protein n=1 Tax=Arvimicrobium flavum TaxID=3393320 RepID=UPI00237AC5E7|nr:glycosyltransferase [Mesorhizobium shangrilense]
MRIAFYAPLKSPNHPVVSGDRQVARLMIRALELAGHTVEVASELRAYMPEPDENRFRELMKDAEGEAQRLRSTWRSASAPDLWFTYHPYYKSPDLIGPRLAKEFSIPYVTLEASYSARRSIGAWKEAQARVVAGVRQAAVNLCLTQRDHDGLSAAVPDAAFAMLPPFVDAAALFGPGIAESGKRLIAVGMMRPGDKLASYRSLANALMLIEHLPWTLSIVGDGPCRDEVRAMFQEFAAERITYHGHLEQPRVFEALQTSDILVWPGCGEAFGLAYLEAQAAGLAVIAQATAGVPEVVRNGETGLLTPEGDAEAYAAAIALLLQDGTERRRLGDNARRFVQHERSLEAAAHRLTNLLPRMAVA